MLNPHAHLTLSPSSWRLTLSTLAVAALCACSGDSASPQDSATSLPGDSTPLDAASSDSSALDSAKIDASSSDTVSSDAGLATTTDARLTTDTAIDSTLALDTSSDSAKPVDTGTDSATGVVRSAGCGKTPSLSNSPSSSSFTPNTVSGTNRKYVIRWPTNYDKNTPYRLILDFHGYGGSYAETAGEDYFGLWNLSNGSTIFVALSANNGTWDATNDLTYVDNVLKAVEADLCIDTSRVMLQGFSQGGAMVATVACARPGVFRAAVGHSRGGLAGPSPSTCKPIPYLGSLGLSDVGGNSQATQTDFFATTNGCTISTLPLAPSGSHVCTNYKGCPAADPAIFCSFDGPHTPLPTDKGKSASWMPSEVWPFLSSF